MRACDCAGRLTDGAIYPRLGPPGGKTERERGKAPPLPLTGDISLRIHALRFVVQCSRLEARATLRSLVEQFCLY